MTEPDIAKKIKAIRNDLEHLNFTQERTNQLLTHIRGWLVAAFVLLLLRALDGN